MRGDVIADLTETFYAVERAATATNDHDALALPNRDATASREQFRLARFVRAGSVCRIGGDIDLAVHDLSFERVQRRGRRGILYMRGECMSIINR